MSITNIPYNTFADNLIIPWSILFLPSGKVLVTERSGYINIFSKDGTLIFRAKVEDVHHVGEGGLLGSAITNHGIKDYNYYNYYKDDKDDKKINNEEYNYMGKNITSKSVEQDIGSKNVSKIKMKK